MTDIFPPSDASSSTTCAEVDRTFPTIVTRWSTKDDNMEWLMRAALKSIFARALARAQRFPRADASRSNRAANKCTNTAVTYKYVELVHRKEFIDNLTCIPFAPCANCSHYFEIIDWAWTQSTHQQHELERGNSLLRRSSVFLIAYSLVGRYLSLNEQMRRTLMNNLQPKMRAKSWRRRSICTMKFRFAWPVASLYVTPSPLKWDKMYQIDD